MRVQPNVLLSQKSTAVTNKTELMSVSVPLKEASFSAEVPTNQLKKPLGLAYLSAVAGVKFSGNDFFYSAVLTPREIKEKLDQSVIGQEEAKRTISTAVHNHIKRIGAQIPLPSVKRILLENATLKGNEQRVNQYLQDLTQLLRRKGINEKGVYNTVTRNMEYAGKNHILYPKADPQTGSKYTFNQLASSLINKLRDELKAKEMDAVSDRLNTVQINKQNILLIGPTGSGKTELARTLANILGVPFCIQNASEITSAGYIGGKSEDIVKKLLDSSMGDTEAAGRGIAFIDEIDKIKRHDSAGASGNDVNGKGAQDSLLKLMEDTDVEIEDKKAKSVKTVNTRNILYIFAGAFSGLTDMIARRMYPKQRSIGFNNSLKSADKLTPDEKKNLLKNVTTEDLIEFGFSPEFVGRIPVIVTLEELTADMLKRILTEPKNALVKQYQKLLEIDGVRLNFTDDAYMAIAQYAIKQGTGARGLHNILEKIMKDICFTAPDLKGPTQYTITGEAVREALGEAIPVEKQQKLAEGEDQKIAASPALKLVRITDEA